MNIVVDFSLFSVIIILYWVMTELFTILFRFTGLPDEKARFQVISLLTGCGFTTHESEMILSNRHRRRLARLTMMFGYVFNITIVSTFINVFLSLKTHQAESFFSGIMLPLTAVTLIFIFMRVPKIRNWGDDLLQRLADRIIRREQSFNTVLLLDYIGGDSIVLVKLHTVPEKYRDVPLSESGLKRDENILVMLVEQPGKKAAPAGADTVFHEGDKLTVFGNYYAICRAFHARDHFTDS